MPHDPADPDRDHQSVAARAVSDGSHAQRNFQDPGLRHDPHPVPCAAPQAGPRYDAEPATVQATATSSLALARGWQLCPYWPRRRNSRRPYAADCQYPSAARGTEAPAEVCALAVNIRLGDVDHDPLNWPATWIIRLGNLQHVAQAGHDAVASVVGV